MADIKVGIGNQETLTTAAPGSKWRNVMLSIGFFCILAALFIGAAMKEGRGLAPRYLALVGLALVVVSAVASLINWISRKANGGAQPIK